MDWDHFWERVERRAPYECWYWKLTPDSKGYGRYQKKPPGVTEKAHRLSYAYEHDIPPEELDPEIEIDHLCHDPQFCEGGRGCVHRMCVNPAHLKMVTPAENTAPGRRRNRNSEKTHCPQGHPYSPENTGYTKEGKRTCKTCKREQDRRRRAKKAPSKALRAVLSDF